MFLESTVSEIKTDVEGDLFIEYRRVLPCTVLPCTVQDGVNPSYESASRGLRMVNYEQFIYSYF